MMQFTNENKDIVFNWMSGNKSAHFENGEPVLRFYNSAGDIITARFGDWIVEDSDIGTYYKVGEA